MSLKRVFCTTNNPNSGPKGWWLLIFNLSNNWHQINCGFIPYLSYNSSGQYDSPNRIYILSNDHLNLLPRSLSRSNTLTLHCELAGLFIDCHPGMVTTDRRSNIHHNHMAPYQYTCPVHTCPTRGSVNMICKYNKLPHSASSSYPTSNRFPLHHNNHPASHWPIVNKPLKFPGLNHMLPLCLTWCPPSTSTGSCRPVYQQAIITSCR